MLSSTDSVKGTHGPYLWSSHHTTSFHLQHSNLLSCREQLLRCASITREEKGVA